MAQQRFWSWKDDDSSFNLSQEKLGIIDNGRYRGFNYAPATTGMTLKLNHQLTGMRQVNLAQVASGLLGVWVTRQGVTVVEDAVIPLPIAVGDATYDRIDLIVGEHEQVTSVGGIAATYSVVQGTPSAFPLRPSLPLPNKHVVLGWLRVPAGTTTLNADMYYEENVPTFAQDYNIAYLNKLQRFTAPHSQFNASWDVSHGKFDITNNALVLGLSDSVGTTEYPANSDAGYFWVFGEVDGNTLPSDYVEVRSLNFAVERTLFSEETTTASRVVIIATTAFKIVSGYGIDTPNNATVYVEAGSTVVLEQPKGNTDLSGGGGNYGWALTSGGETKNAAKNKIRGLISQSVKEVTVDSFFKLDRGSSTRNNLMITNANDATGFDKSKVQFISVEDYSLDEVEQGTEITLFAEYPMQIMTAYSDNGSGVASDAAPAGYKAIYNPSGWHMNIKSGGSVTLIEMGNYWLVKNVSGELPYWVPLRYYGTMTGNAATCKMAGVVLFKGHIQKEVGVGGTFPVNSGNTIAGVFPYKDLQGEYVFACAPGDNKHLRYKEGTTAPSQWYDAQVDFGSSGGINISLLYHATLANTNGYFFYLDGLSFTA